MRVRYCPIRQEVYTDDNPGDPCPVPERTALLALRGSLAHNLFVPKNDPKRIDDIDLMGITIGTPEMYLGLSQSNGTQEIKQGAWDIVYYDIRKAFGLLLAGNPNVISLLSSLPEHYLKLDETGVRILQNRSIFIGKHIYHHFAGYANTQLQKMTSRDPAEVREYLAVTAELKYRGAHPNRKGEQFPRPERTQDNWYKGEELNAWQASTDVLLRKLRSFQKKGENIGYLGDKRKHLVLEVGYDAKNAAHCIRLLKMCIEFLETGEMNVCRTADRQELLDIKKGLWKLEDVQQYAASLFDQARQAYEKSSLPAEPDHAAAEKLLVSILSDCLKSK